MKKRRFNKITAWFIMLCMLAGMLATPIAVYAEDPPSVPWEDGSGVEGDPYLINDVNDLIALSDIANMTYWSAHFEQTDDITLPDLGEGVSNWTPIGSVSYPFRGTFDGNGKTISNLTINDHTLEYVGMFGYVGNGGRLENIRLQNADVSSSSSSVKIGTLSGHNGGGYISNCSSDGSVTGGVSAVAGGLIGMNMGSTHYNYSTVRVTGGNNAFVGGLIGTNMADIMNSYSSSIVIGGEYAYVGGLVGETFGAVIYNYSTSSVTGGNNAFVGGLIGMGGHPDRSYFDKNVAGTEYPYGHQQTDPNSLGKTTAQMMQQETFLNWDFAGIWKIGENVSHPTLQWQPWTADEEITADMCALTRSAIKGSNTDIDNVTARIDLPATGDKGSTIAWSASLTGWISTTTGAVTWPTDENKTVALTATVSKGDGAVQTKDFILTIAIPSADWQGDGASSETAYEVESAAHLNDIRNKMGEGVYFKQTAENIDLSGINWTPIGDANTPFAGVFDGNGKTISNLTIHDDSLEYVGLFGYVCSSGTLEDITIVNFEGSSSFYIPDQSSGEPGSPDIPERPALIGSLVGYNEGTIINSSSSGSSNSSGKNARVGGLVGYNMGIVTDSSSSGIVNSSGINLTASNGAGGLVGRNSGTVSNSNSIVTVSGGSNSLTGGLIGFNDAGTVSGSSSSGSVSGGDNSNAGGLVGKNMGGTVRESSSSCTVNGGNNSKVGGLVGDNMKTNAGAASEVNDSYSTGNVTGADNSTVGGLVGDNGYTTSYYYGNISNSYSIGSVSGGDSAKVGGLVGNSSYESVSNSYYNSASADTSTGGTALSLEDMKQQENFITTSSEGNPTGSWDFNTIWRIIEGYSYPKLQWEQWTAGEANEIIARDKAALELTYAQGDSVGNVTQSLTLPAEGANGAIISWSANPTGWINTTTGAVSRPSYSQGDQSVTITATVSITGGASQTKDFTLTIKAAPRPVDTSDNSNNGSYIPTPTPTPEPTPIQTPTPEPIVAERGKVKVTHEKEESGNAVADIDISYINEAFEGVKTNNDGRKNVVIELPAVEGAAAYESTLPATTLTSKEADRQITLATDFATVTLPGNMLETEEQEAIQKVSLTISRGDVSAIQNEEVRTRIGDRPLIQLNLKVDGEKVAWRNESSPVTVSIPYTPTEEELLDPEYITIWYIDGEGNVIEVPSGRYNPATGMVTFGTTHFSDYAVVYVKKTFEDIKDITWANKQIEVLASKGIIRGTSESEYAPSESIIRADFLYYLVRALGFDTRFDNNFDDIDKDAYYYKEIGIAKKLGITNGTGDNRFSPDASITRQDMFVLTERALRILRKPIKTGKFIDLMKFTDRSQIADYAKDSIAALTKEGLIEGDGNRLKPLSNTSRAEAAVFIYRLYNLK